MASAMLLEKEESNLKAITLRISNDHAVNIGHQGSSPSVHEDNKTIVWQTGLLDYNYNCTKCEQELERYVFLNNGRVAVLNEYSMPPGFLAKCFHDEEEEVCPTYRNSVLPPYNLYADTSKLRPGEPGYSLGFWDYSQIVTYRGVKMQRRSAVSIWECEVKEYERAQTDAKYDQKSRKREREKEDINYQKATYKGKSLYDLRLYYTDELKNLEPQTIKDLEEADRINPLRQKERRQRELQKQKEELLNQLLGK